MVDGLPAALAGQDVLPMDKSSLANLLLARFALRTAPHACAPDPTVAFELWRSLTFLLGYDRLQPKVFRECTSSARKVGAGGSTWMAADHSPPCSPTTYRQHAAAVFRSYT